MLKFETTVLSSLVVLVVVLVVSALANLITKILPFILMRKAGADAAVKKGLKKVAKLRTKKDKLKESHRFK